MKPSRKLTVNQRKNNYGYYMDAKNCENYKGNFEQWLKKVYRDLI